MVIRKYVLESGVDRVAFNIPQHAKILGIFYHLNRWCLWVLGHPDAPLYTRHFRVFRGEVETGAARQDDYIGGYWDAGTSCLMFEEYP